MRDLVLVQEDLLGHHSRANGQSPLPRFSAILFLLSLLCLPGNALASTALDNWRGAVLSAQEKAENNAPGTYAEAQRLQAGMPPDATSADKARVLNLLARIESFLAFKELSAQHARQALSLAEQSGDKAGQVEALLNYAVALDMTGTSAREKNEVRILDLVQRYASSNKQHQLDELKFRNDLMWAVLGSGGILLVITTYFMLHLRRARKQIQSLNAGLERRVETLLQERVAEFRTLVENATDPIFRYDRECRRVYVNPAVERISGIPAAKLLGKTPTAAELIPSADSVKIQQSIERVLKTGKPETIEVSYIAPDGGELFFQNAHVPEFGADGSVESVLSIGRDITSRKQFERVLQEHLELEQRQSKFFNVVPGYFYTLERRTDGSFAITFASPGIAEIYGVSAEAVMKDFSVFDRINHPDDLGMIIREAEESGRNLTPYHLEYRIVHPVRGVRWIEAHSLPQRMPGGGTRWDGFMHDITERKRIEADLETEKMRLNAFFHALPNMAWIKDVEGKYLACNPVFETLFGAPEAEIIGKTDYDFVDADQAAFFRQKDAEAIAAGVPTVNEEWVCFAVDKRWALMEVVKAPLRDAEGRIIGVLGLAQDITERKQAEITIRESEARYRASSDLLHSILESSPEVTTFALDGNYRYIGFNSRHKNMMRTLWGKDIALGTNMLDAIGGQAEREAAKRNFDCALSGESFALEEYSGDAQSSREYWQNFWSPIRSDAGVIVGLTCFSLNISWRKRMEVELANSRNFLDKIINAVPASIFVKDRRRRFVMLNDACCRLFGQPREALLGKCDEDFFPPEEAAALRERDELVFASGEISVSEDSVTGKNGETHYLYTTKLPFRSSDENILLVGVNLDITERKRHELERETTQKQLAEQHAQLQVYQNELENLVKERTAELVASNQHLRVQIEVREQIENRLKRAVEFAEGVVNAIPDMLFEMDGTGRFLNVWTQNPQLLPVPKDELIGGNVSALLGDEAAEIVMGAINDAEINGTSFGKVIRISRPRGDGWFELSVAKQSSPDLDDSHFLVLSRDITSRKNTEQALLESREQLSGLIAHREEVREEERKYIAREVHDELGQILSGLQLNISLLDFKFAASSPALHDYVQETMSLTDKAIQAVRHIASALRPVELDMGIVAALKWQAERFGSHSGIQCEVRIPDEEIGLEEAQAIALFRIVQESLTNILRHAKADRVVISLVEDGDAYVLKVRDNGKGFDISKKKANSFGLVGIRERALMLGGTVSINSQRGKGTEIEVRVPFIRKVH